MVAAQGGDARVVDDPSRLPQSKVQLEISAPRAGYITAIDALALGKLAIELGAGRTRAEQRIDPAAGFELHGNVGSRLAKGEPIVTIHAASRALTKCVAERVTGAFTIQARAPRRRPLVLARIL